MAFLEFDSKKFIFKKRKISVWPYIRSILIFLLVSISMTIFYYAIFALFFSTDTEKKLQKQIKAYRAELPHLEENKKILADALGDLQIRDNAIYEQIFHTPAPQVDPESSLDYLYGIESISDEDLVLYSQFRLKFMESSAGRVEENLQYISQKLVDTATILPPLTSPIENLSFSQVGASVGDKINPLYKVEVAHNGLDLITPLGEPVYASADGKVIEVQRSRKGLGNIVALKHEGGYITRYASLSDIKVRKDAKVKRGDLVGLVGITPQAYAPHLHYEVLRDSVILDPVNHLFVSVDPKEYINILIMSINTAQSMD